VKTVSCFVALLTVVAVCLAPGFGIQVARPPAAIAKVEILVDGLSGESMTDLVSIKPGEPYSAKKIRDNIKQIYQTGLFSDIRVLKSGADRVDLTFLLIRRLIVGNIIFQGGRDVSPTKLRESLYSLRPGSAFSENGLERAKEELKAALKEEGFFEPEIGASAGRTPQGAVMDILFEVMPGKRYSIRSLSFSPQNVLDEGDLRKNMKSRPGKPYIPSLLAQDISRLKDLFRGSGYERAEINVDRVAFHREEQRVSLVLRINPQEKITIIIRGADVPRNLLKPIWEERIFEEWGQAEGEARILSYLRNEGFLFSSVSSSIEKTETELKIIHDVRPGEKFRIQDISFEGLSRFKPAELKRMLGITQHILFFGLIDGKRVFEIPREIQAVYREEGFPDAEVSLNFIKQGKKVKAVFFVQEGSRHWIGGLRITGASLFPEDELKAQLANREGGPYFQPNLQRDVEKLETYYLNQGVRGTRVTVKTESADAERYDLTFEIDEGRIVKIEKIIIAGTGITKISTVLKELKIREGVPAASDAILQSKRNLERLGIFSEVKAEEIPVSPNAENVILNLREGERNYASIGIGLETKTEPRSFEVWNNTIRLRGTAEVSRGNIFGTASQLSFVSQLSIKETRGVLSWEQPYFFGFLMRTYLNAWLEREERKSFGFDQRGTSLTGIKQLTDSDVLIGTLRWVRTVLTYLEITESEVDRQYYPFSATSLSLSYIRDRRNDSFNPDRGYFFSGVAEWAYPLFKAESDYFKTFFKYQHFVPVFSRFNSNLTVRLGLGMGRMPIHERFFGGGSNSFRGEKIDELGPEDPQSGKPVGGKALCLFNFEIRFPLTASLRELSGAVFFDTGNVFAKRSQFDLLDFKSAVGFGLRYRTPLGPLRFDLAWNLNAPERKGRPFAFITIGNMF